MDELSQSYIDDGTKAFKEGIARIQNPHPEDTAPYYLWDRGWEAAAANFMKFLKFGVGA